METKIADALGHDKIAERLKARLNRDDFEDSTARWMGVYREAVKIHREREKAKTAAA